MIQELLVRPCQFHESPPLSWSKKLLYAILWEAVEAVKGCTVVAGENGQDNVQRRRYRKAVEALDWFLSDNDEPQPISFIYLCSHLGLDPVVYRAKAQDLFLTKWTPIDLLVDGTVYYFTEAIHDPFRAAHKQPAWRAWITRQAYGRAKKWACGWYWSRLLASTAAKNTVAKLKQEEKERKAA